MSWSPYETSGTTTDRPTHPPTPNATAREHVLSHGPHLGGCIARLERKESASASTSQPGDARPPYAKCFVAIASTALSYCARRALRVNGLWYHGAHRRFHFR